ncbi:DUF1190 domain-containing protein [Roseomonas terrae]|jgi:uncharacterized protein YgiB involved in biofilm formation|uniref:DUF1190 domain-containing protein n=1 Tax=Neoroseomonas terrae TaxID=424799 RepID=A0ABS5EMF8_9PROT|nr:DUF1190 domain-containing protein [Neoroseomonas terrae]MBR0651807.1 DUF1190 domain-containing protein [Neoroseomonas terrae]
MSSSPPPSRRRSRTIRAAALVTIGLGAAGCDETPPADLPDATEARLEACRAAHRRLSEDPARCDALEQVLSREQAETRPRFTTISACETLFGRGACEGETLAATGPGWRPALAGWVRAPGEMGVVQPVVRDRQGQDWALPEPTRPTTTGAVAVQAAPRQVSALDYNAASRAPLNVSLAYYRLAPVYPDDAACSAEWQSCERFDLPLPTRFGTQEACRATWSQCMEVELPPAALAMATTEEQQQQGQSGGGTSSGSGGRVWWGGYNAFWYRNYGGGIGPRYQGWTWTADRQPTAAYRPAVGAGPLRAWDSRSRSLGQASRMGFYGEGTSARTSGPTVSRPASTITRAGFGSTGRAYSSGG